MTDRHNDGTPPSVRLMTDGGTEPQTVTRTAVADGVVTREVDGEDQDMIRVPISSTRADREGDRFTKDALEGMADQIRSENPMVFDNHGLAGSWMEAIPYDSRETIGAQMDAELESAEDGEWDLFALVNPDGTHPEGERLLGQVRDEGQPIKFSVGFRVLDYDAIEDDAGNEIGREFTRSDLMETSRVGIPANPDASVTQSMTAKGGGGALPGIQNHPMMQMFAAMGQGETPTDAERDTAGHAVTKDGVDSETVQEGTPVEVDGQPETTERDAATDGGDALRERIDQLEATVSDLARAVKDDDGDTAEKGSCDADADCPDGEVCVDGECVPVDDGDDDGEESSITPEVVDELREEDAELAEEVASVRESLSEGRGDSKSGDTTVTKNTPEPEETDSDDGDADRTEPKTAMDLAREGPN